MAGAILVVGCGSAAADLAETRPTDTAVPAPTSAPVDASATTTTAPIHSPSRSSTEPTTPTTTIAAADTTSTIAAADTTSTIAATGTSSDTNGPAAGCRRLEEFGPDVGAWLIVNDGVMGGRSDGRGAIDDSTLSFFGTVVTAGGGFTSVRLRLDGSELDGTERIRVRLRPDDRTYGFTFEDDQTVQGRPISHGSDLPGPTEVDADGFAEIELPYSELRPSIFGQAVDADPFDPDEASEIGIIIADGIDGDFEIDVDWIDVCS